MNGEEHWKCYKQGHRDGRIEERERCAAELAVCRWLCPWRNAEERFEAFCDALDEAEYSRLLDEDPLPEGWMIDFDNTEKWDVQPMEGEMTKPRMLPTYKSAVRLAWALEQGLELDQ